MFLGSARPCLPPASCTSLFPSPSLSPWLGDWPFPTPGCLIRPLSCRPFHFPAQNSRPPGPLPPLRRPASGEAAPHASAPPRAGGAAGELSLYGRWIPFRSETESSPTDICSLCRNAIGTVGWGAAPCARTRVCVCARVSGEGSPGFHLQRERPHTLPHSTNPFLVLT